MIVNCPVCGTPAYKTSVITARPLPPEALALLCKLQVQARSGEEEDGDAFAQALLDHADSLIDAAVYTSNLREVITDLLNRLRIALDKNAQV